MQRTMKSFLARFASANLRSSLMLTVFFFLISGPHAIAFQSADTTSSKKTADRESFEKLALRAQSAMNAEQIPEAIRLYAQATRLRPDWSEGWWFLGTLLFDTERFKEAQNAFTHFLATERKQREPGFAMLGLTEFELKHYEKALAALERSLKPGLQADPQFARNVLLHDGMLNALIGKPDLALQRLTLAANQIAAAYPEAPKDHVLSDTELLDAFGIAALRMRTLPSDLATDKKAEIRQTGRAQALIAIQDRVAAEIEFQQLLTQYASESGVNYAYGVFLLKEHPSQAASAFRRELEISPSHVAARIQLALRSLETGEYEDGIAFAEQAIDLEPSNFVAHVALGKLYLELGKTDLAIRELQMSVKLSPGSPDAHFALERAFLRANRKAEAKRERAVFERLKALSDAANQQ
jgi:tetratricopeptide (TPR) repeat protein